jgi:hypothetical protein
MPLHYFRGGKFIFAALKKYEGRSEFKKDGSDEVVDFFVVITCCTPVF